MSIAPRRFGPYEVLRKLGAGAMGSVYLARDSRIDRLVALKFPKVEQEAVIQRLVREARLAARLEHPHICRIHLVDQCEGRWFIDMAYVEGPTLEEEIARDLMPPAGSVAREFQLMADALEHAHARSIVHRDLKPANVVMARHTESIHPIVMDFGLALHLGPTMTRLTETGAIVGTPNYMAPEQLGGADGEVGPAADIYALGAMLYERLTGRRPFHGTPLQVLAKVIIEDPPRPSVYRPGLDEELERLCLSMLAKSPGDRPPNMGEVRRRLVALSNRLTDAKDETAERPAAVGVARLAPSGRHVSPDSSQNALFDHAQKLADAGRFHSALSLLGSLEDAELAAHLEGLRSQATQLRNQLDSILESLETLDPNSHRDQWLAGLLCLYRVCHGAVTVP